MLITCWACHAVEMAGNAFWCCVKNLHSRTISVGLYADRFVFSPLSVCQTRGYAKKVAAKAKGKGMAKEAFKGPEVCKDPVRLTTHAVGVNVFKQGEDPVLKAPEEYPEWLFQLNLGAPKKISEMEPDSREYWRLLRKEHMWRFNRLHKGRKM